jgi:hypothetical protein
VIALYAGVMGSAFGVWLVGSVPLQDIQPDAGTGHCEHRLVQTFTFIPPQMSLDAAGLSVRGLVRPSIAILGVQVAAVAAVSDPSTALKEGDGHYPDRKDPSPNDAHENDLPPALAGEGHACKHQRKEGSP